MTQQTSRPISSHQHIRGRLLTLAQHLASLLPWLLVVGLSILNLRHASQLGVNDDAYITYRVARNLALGHGPVFNPGERVLTITNPGYMLLLALLSPFSQDFVLLGLVVNGLALLALGALLIELSARRDQGTTTRREAASSLYRWLPATIAVVLVFTHPLLNAAIGMETPLYMAAIMATFAAYRRALMDPPGSDRWLLGTAVAAALAFLLRPDGLLVGIAVGLHWLFTRRRIPWRALVVGVALSLPWLLFAWAYYGSPIPNTLVAKSTQALGGVPSWGQQLLTMVFQWSATYPWGAGLAIVGAVAALLERRGDRLAMLSWFVIYAVGHSLIGVRSYFWYYLPLLPVVALLAGDGAIALVNWLTHRVAGEITGSTRAWLIGRLFALLFLVLVVGSAAKPTAVLAEEGMLTRRTVVHTWAAGVLSPLCSKGGVRLGVAEVGLVGYISNCPIVDFSGLLQKDLAHLALSPADKIAWTIKSYEPELIVLSGASDYPHMIADAPWFRSRYVLIDSQKDQGFHNVIYRRTVGPARQRSLPGAVWWRTDLPAHDGGQDEQVLEELEFDVQASQDITLHAYLPPDSTLAVSANGEPMVDLAGQTPTWQDVRLEGIEPDDAGHVTLVLEGEAGEQPASVAWIQGDMVPAVHYFQGVEDHNRHPRPSRALEPGQHVAVSLAAATSPGSIDLELLHRDRPGVALSVLANGQKVANVGGHDGWRLERLSLPAPTGPITSIELRNEGQETARLTYVALVPGEASSD